MLNVFSLKEKYNVIAVENINDLGGMSCKRKIFGESLTRNKCTEDTCYRRDGSRMRESGSEIHETRNCFHGNGRENGTQSRTDILQSSEHKCNVPWTFRSFLPQVSWTHVLISNSWQAWLGIVDQNWLKLALAKLALGQSIFLKVVGMPTPVKTTVRSKFPFICM